MKILQTIQRNIAVIDPNQQQINNRQLSSGLVITVAVGKTLIFLKSSVWRKV